MEAVWKIEALSKLATPKNNWLKTVGPRAVPHNRGDFVRWRISLHLSWWMTKAPSLLRKKRPGAWKAAKDFKRTLTNGISYGIVNIYLYISVYIHDLTIHVYLCMFCSICGDFLHVRYLHMALVANGHSWKWKVSFVMRAFGI